MKHLVLLLGLALATPAIAFDDTDRQAVETTVDRFVAGLLANDRDAMAMPPGMINFLAKAQNTTPEELRDAMYAEIEKVMQQVTVQSVDADFDGMTTGTLDTGQRYAFVVLNSTFLMADGQSLESEALNIAAEVDGDWYLVRLGSPQHWQLFQAAYPEFQSVDVPK